MKWQYSILPCSTESHSPPRCAHYATEGQVSLSCKTATIHSSSSTFHLRWMLHHMVSCGYLQHPDSDFTAFDSLLQNHAVSRFHVLHESYIYRQNPEFEKIPSSCQTGSGQSEWCLTEKGATGCGGIWIQWSFMPRFYVSVGKTHRPQFGSWFQMEIMNSELWTPSLHPKCLQIL